MRVLAVRASAAALAAVPAVAAADAPWTAPVAVPDAGGYDASVVITAAGHGALLTNGGSGEAVERSSLVTSVSPADESGRQEVAWQTQRVNEGDAASPSTVSYTSAARGHGFTTARIVGRSDLTGTGRYVSAPGVRLAGSGSDSSVLAFTVFDGTSFRVQVANAVAGTVQDVRLHRARGGQRPGRSSAAVDPVTGWALAAFGYLPQRVLVSARSPRPDDA